MSTNPIHWLDRACDAEGIRVVPLMMIGCTLSVFWMLVIGSPVLLLLALLAWIA
jgi:hypothetical protein